MLKEHEVVRPSNGEPPERVCFVQCVGSRDRHIGNEYCSKVCCGVASKEAIEVRQLLPDCKVYIFYIDMRMYGYWENEIYWAAQEKHHVQYVKGIITEVLAKGDQLIVRGEDTTMGRPMELLMDMVVLSVGMEPSAGTREVAAMLGIRAEPVRLHRRRGRPARPGVPPAARASSPAAPRWAGRSRGHGVVGGQCRHARSRVRPRAAAARRATEADRRWKARSSTLPLRRSSSRMFWQVCSSEELAGIGDDLQRKSTAMRALAGDDPAADGRRHSSGAARLGVLHPSQGGPDLRHRSNPPSSPPGSPICCTDPAGSTARYERFAALLEPCPGSPTTCPVSCCTSSIPAGTGCGPGGCGIPTPRPARSRW